MTPPQASSFLVAGFVVLSVALAAAFVLLVAWAGRRMHEPRASTWRWVLLTAVGAAVWMSLTWLAAASGVLAHFDRRPPPFFFLFISVLVVSAAIGLSPLGSRLARGLPLAALVGFQSFRLPLELLMHRAADEGVMPPQMSYSGWNFDIVTGGSAIVVAFALSRGASPRLASAWNAMGALLLANIVGIAVTSLPIVAAFGQDHLNTWVAYPPFVWLPTVMVVLALSGHLVIWRAVTGRAGRAGRAGR